MIVSSLTPPSPRRLLRTACLAALLATTVTSTPIEPLAVLNEDNSTSSSSTPSSSISSSSSSSPPSSSSSPPDTSSAGKIQINRDFPDPGIVRDSSSGDWYSFATNGNGKNVQMARAPDPLGPWEWINEDAMPDTSWTTGSNTWAPDVRRLPNDTYVLYFSGELPNNTSKHCVGVALSPNVTGPYEPFDEPWVCALDGGGAIDAAGFFDDANSRRYVSYKVDGNHIGNGGDCNNGVEPIVPTPIMLQEVDPEDGHTKIGEPVEIFDRTEADGPLVEAPDIIRIDGRGGDGDSVYVLFFSSFCYQSSKYNVNYAVSASGVEGPYMRAERPLLMTGDYDLEGPGGATNVAGGGQIVFHARCDHGRCLHATRYVAVGGDIIVD